MALYFVVTAMQSGLAQSSLADNQQIASAFDDVSSHRPIQTPSGISSIATGTFISAVPRITRSHRDWLSRPMIYASNVYRVPDARMRLIPTPDAQAQFSRRVAEYLLLALEDRASSPTATWDVRVHPYRAQSNGDISWWESGAAAQEPAWKLTFPSAWDLTVGQEIRPDNPDGPNALVSNTPVQRPDAINHLPLIIGVVVLGIALVELGPIISAAASRPSKPKSNPRRILSRR